MSKFHWTCIVEVRVFRVKFILFHLFALTFRIIMYCHVAFLVKFPQCNDLLCYWWCWAIMNYMCPKFSLLLMIEETWVFIIWGIYNEQGSKPMSACWWISWSVFYIFCVKKFYEKTKTNKEFNKECPSIPDWLDHQSSICPKTIKNTSMSHTVVMDDMFHHYNEIMNM